ncbi:MAG: peptide ABC transporter substrate-binding protein [Gemmatimonadaceae bacterium]
MGRPVWRDDVALTILIEDHLKLPAISMTHTDAPTAASRPAATRNGGRPAWPQFPHWRSAAALILLATVLACNNERTQGAVSGGTLVVSTASDADYLFPPLIISTQGREIAEQIFEPLANIGDSLNVFGDAGFTPALADSWIWASDSLSIAFHLHPGARWHDGQPVRARDVQFTIALCKNPDLASPIAPLLSEIDSVTIADSLTPVFWFKRRTAQQFYDAANLALIVPEHVYGAIPASALAASPLLRTPVGSGRFRFRRWVPNATIEIVSNRAHYRSPARLDRVIWTIAPSDFGAASTRFLAGDADLFAAVRASMVPQIAKSDKLRLIEYPGFRFGYMVFNMRDPANPRSPNPLFKNVAMRRALTMAVDRAAIVRNVFDSLAIPSVGPTVRAMATTDTTIPQIPFDPPRAMHILDSLGWHPGPDGIRVRNGEKLAFSIMVPSTSMDRQRLAVLMQDQFTKIGVAVTIASVEPNVFEQQQHSHKFDAAIENWTADPSPAGIRESWGSSAAHTEGSKNYGDYANASFDSEVDSALAAPSRLVARGLYSHAFRTLISDAPAVWLYEPRNMIGIQKRFHVAELRADAWWAHLADWYVPENEQTARDRAGTGDAPASTTSSTPSGNK